MIQEIILILQTIIISGGLIYIYFLLNKKIDKITTKSTGKIIKKLRGITPEASDNIKKFDDAIKTDVKNAWEQLEVNDKVKALEGFDNFQELANANPEGLGEFMSSNVLFDVVLPLLQQSGNLDVASIVQLLNVKNASVLAGGAMALKFVQTIMKNRANSDNNVHVQKAQQKFPVFPEIP